MIQEETKNVLAILLATLGMAGWWVALSMPESGAPCQSPCAAGTAHFCSEGSQDLCAEKVSQPAAQEVLDHLMARFPWRDVTVEVVEDPPDALARTYPVEQGEDGSWSFHIKVWGALCWRQASEILIHEYAHVLSGELAFILGQDPHGPIFWGVMETLYTATRSR